MRIHLCFVILPTAHLQDLSRTYLGDQFFEGSVWTTSQHHSRYEQPRELVEQAAWTDFLGFCDLNEQGDQELLFLRECLKLGFSGCFDVHELAFPESAARLLANAELLKPLVEGNLARLAESG